MTSCCVPTCRAPSTSRDETGLPVAIIGGGPVGLAAALHLLDRGLNPVIFESGPSVGTAALAWGHVRMFSPWRYNVDKACRVALEQGGWTSPDPEAFPTGRELTEQYLKPLAQLPQISSRLRVNARVNAVARLGFGKVKTVGRETAPFEIRTVDGDGHETVLLASAVIDTSGTWLGHAWAGASGIPAMGEIQAALRTFYGMPDLLGDDRSRYAGRKTMVVGSGDSAKGTLIDLAKLAGQSPSTSIIWAARNADLTRAFGGGLADGLAERGALGTRVRALIEAGKIAVLKPFAIDRIASGKESLSVSGTDEHGTRTVGVDEIIVCTGFRPDLSMLSEIRLDLDPALECPRALAPLIDPNVHSCGSVRPHGAAELQQPEAGLFIAGMKAYGRAPTFLLATGYEQVRSIAAYLAGDIEASLRVELDVPETGVCSSNLSLAASDCCAVPVAVTCCAPAKEPAALPAGE